MTIDPADAAYPFVVEANQKAARRRARRGNPRPWFSIGAGFAFLVFAGNSWVRADGFEALLLVWAGAALVTFWQGVRGFRQEALGE